jgi:hypothetical protein
MQWVKLETEAFTSFLQESCAANPATIQRGMPLGFMARSGLIDSLMFAEVRSKPLISRV